MMDCVRFGIVIEALHHLPIWAAVQNGWYRDRGLDVELSVMHGIDEVTSALKAGTIDICVGSPEHVIDDVEQGGSLRIVGGNVSRPTHYLIVQPEITSLRGLDGKTLGVSALTGGTSSLFVDVLGQVGLDQSRYHIVAAGVVPPRHEKLLSGEIDAAMQTDPHNYIAEDAGLGNLGPVSQWIPYVMFSSFNSNLAWSEPHAATLTRVLGATIEASRWMYEQRAAAVDLASAWMGIDRRYAERAWDDLVGGECVPADLHVKRAALQKTLDLMERDRGVAFGPSVGPEKYVMLDYLEAAQRALGVPVRAMPDQ